MVTIDCFPEQVSRMLWCTCRLDSASFAKIAMDVSLPRSAPPDVPLAAASLPENAQVSCTAVSLSSPAGLLASRLALAGGNDSDKMYPALDTSTQPVHLIGQVGSADLDGTRFASVDRCLHTRSLHTCSPACADGIQSSWNWL